VKAVVVLADGFEEIEAVTPIDILRRAGVEVVVAGLTSLSVRSARGLTVTCDVCLVDAPAGLLVLPGGLAGAQALAASADVHRAIASSLAEDRPVAAICATPALVLGAHGYLKGRRFTCYPGMESEVVDGKPSPDAVVIDGPWITSRGVGTAPAFALALVERLAGRARADEVARAVLWA